MFRLEKIQMNRVGRFFCSTEWMVYENDIPLGAAYHVECQNADLSFDTDILENVREEIKRLLEYVESDFGVFSKRSSRCPECGAPASEVKKWMNNAID
jgi:uncharacterized protein (UPF0212 family)